MYVYLNMNENEYLLRCWNAMDTSVFVSGLYVIFSKLFSILHFSWILTKTLKEKIVNLIITVVGFGWEGKSEYLRTKRTRTEGWKGKKRPSRHLITSTFLLLRPLNVTVAQREDAEQTLSWMKSYSDPSIATLEWIPPGRIHSRFFIWRDHSSFLIPTLSACLYTSKNPTENFK